VQLSDIKGVLHCHSLWSDGANSIAEMAAAVRAMGCSYMCITDHSKSAAYAGGLQIERVLRQHEEIDALNADHPEFYIFKGIESDILKDGSLDYPQDVLALFDCIVASVHSGLKMGDEEATKRLIAAIENSYTTVLGHPTGRLLLKRQGYQPDMHRVIDAAAANGTAIEINGNPYRLDLDWSLVAYAANKGVRIALTSDAHNLPDLAYHEWAVRMAQKGFLPKALCINALPLAEFAKAIAAKRNA
jgi:DNA polymerase (family 10)